MKPAALALAIPGARPRVLVMVHGLCMSDSSWNRNGHDHGECLARDLDADVIYLRYNTGRHISTNGAEFALQLEQLVAAWPVPVRELVLVGHSMGGLVIRSACSRGRDGATLLAAPAEIDRVSRYATPRRTNGARGSRLGPPVRREPVHGSIFPPRTTTQRRHHRPAARCFAATRIGAIATASRTVATCTMRCRCRVRCARLRWPAARAGPLPSATAHHAATDWCLLPQPSAPMTTSIAIFTFPRSDAGSPTVLGISSYSAVMPRTCR